MYTPPSRYPQLKMILNMASGTALVAGFALLLLGVLGIGDNGSVWMVAAGLVLLLTTVLVMTAIPLALKIEAGLAHQLDQLKQVSDALERQATVLQSIEENTRISDAAKSLAHRDQELDALRAAIREDIRQRRWEAALALIDEMEQRHGFREEAEQIRDELDDARNRAIEAKLDEAIGLIETHFDEHEWGRAEFELNRLLRAVPDDSRVSRLRDRMEMLKKEHKTELLKAWDVAVERNDTDHAIDVLRELDQYLSTAEAESLQQAARSVFKEKLLQLGVQFRFAVTERRWQDALNCGLELVREFPNARMATEVREALDTLRDRARSGDGAVPTADSLTT